MQPSSFINCSFVSFLVKYKFLFNRNLLYICISWTTMMKHLFIRFRMGAFSHGEDQKLLSFTICKLPSLYSSHLLSRPCCCLVQCVLAVSHLSPLLLQTRGLFFLRVYLYQWGCSKSASYSVPRVVNLLHPSGVNFPRLLFFRAIRWSLCLSCQLNFKIHHQTNKDET